MRLEGKKIVLGITGSIAAYKAAVLLRHFIKEGAEVQVVITDSGKEFITPLTLSALSGKPVLNAFFGKDNGSWNSHVDLGLWADVMVIAPATASTIGKMANGIADNLLVTTYMSMKCPVFIAPAMDLDMYAHPSTCENLKTLRGFGNRIIEPASGFLASGLQGKGRMEEPEKILEIITNFLFSQKELVSKKFLVTAGPTFEKIDPVRFIGNYSSGKMGYALAEEIAARGAEVILVSGPVALKPVNEKITVINVESASEMLESCLTRFPYCDGAIMCAAVADFTPALPENHKKKREKSNWSLELKPTEDIAAKLGNIKKDNQILVGFALETQNEIENALKKLTYKNLDFIVLNSLNNAGSGFGTDTNKITIIDKYNNQQDFELKSKVDVASDIVNKLISILR